MTVVPKIIEGKYLKDILDQPKVLEATLNGLLMTSELDGLLRRLAKGEFKRVILTAMGSSYLAFYPLTVQLVGVGLTACMVDTSELLYYQSELLAPDTLLVLNSQSGSSAEIVHLLDLIGGKVPVIGITNTAGSPLATRANATIQTRAGSEYSTACKTYVTGLLALAWLAGLIQGQQPEQIKRKLDLAAPAVYSYLMNWKEYVQDLCGQLTGVRNLYFAGRGASLAAAYTAGLVIKEAAHFQAEGMGSAALRHGPFEIMLPETYVVVYDGDPKTAQANRRLVEDISGYGSQARLVKSDPASNVFHLPPVPDEIRPILEAMPVQMFTLALAANAGREAGVFDRIGKITTTE
ncbi:MAG: SIS domain-containing protein [Anaerolineaceae bacterium]|nr:SIS domain-containing protein [Anaerolineaceae bacterium]